MPGPFRLKTGIFCMEGIDRRVHLQLTLFPEPRRSVVPLFRCSEVILAFLEAMPSARETCYVYSRLSFAACFRQQQEPLRRFAPLEPDR